MAFQASPTQITFRRLIRLTVHGWCKAVRTAKRNGARVFVAMHMFSGERRKGDVRDWTEKYSMAHGLILLFLSADLELTPIGTLPFQLLFMQYLLCVLKAWLTSLWPGHLVPRYQD